VPLPVPPQWVPPLVVWQAVVPVARQRPVQARVVQQQPVQVSAFQQQQVLSAVVLQQRAPALVEQPRSVQITAVRLPPLQARVMSSLLTA